MTSVMVDSGATSHMKRDTTGLTNVRRHYGHVYGGNGDKLEVHSIGDWIMKVNIAMVLLKVSCLRMYL